MELPARLWPYVRYGPAAGALAVAKRGLRRWLELGSIVVFTQPVVEEPVAGPPDVTLREIAEADIPALARAFERDGGDLWGRLARGDRGFGAFDAKGGRPLHMRWTTSAPTWIPEVALWIKPRAGEVYSYDAQTVPEARGRRIYDAVRRHGDAALSAAGIVRRLVYVRSDNHAMWRALRGSAVRPLARLFYLRIAGNPPIVLGRYGSPLREVGS